MYLNIFNTSLLHGRFDFQPVWGVAAEWLGDSIVVQKGTQDPGGNVSFAVFAKRSDWRADFVRASLRFKGKCYVCSCILRGHNFTHRILTFSLGTRCHVARMALRPWTKVWQKLAKIARRAAWNRKTRFRSSAYDCTVHSLTILFPFFKESKPGYLRG